MGSKRRDPRWFEQWAAKICMRPVGKVEDPDGDILLADSCEPIREIGKYRTGYAINRDGLEIGYYVDFDMGLFIGLSREAGIQERVSALLERAREVQTELKNSGFYDGEGKGRFSHRPN